MQIETRLLDHVGLPGEHLFCTRAELIEQAYDLQAERIAFREDEPEPAASGDPE